MRRFVAVSVLVLLAACGTSGPTQPTPTTESQKPTSSPTSSHAGSPPEVAVEGLMRALDDGDCSRAKKLVVTPSELGCDVVEQSKDSFADEGIDLDEVTYRAGSIQDASTTVTITWGNDYPAESYDVQKIGGDWKVVFDSVA